MAEVIQHIESNIIERSKATQKIKLKAIELFSELKEAIKLCPGVEGRTELRKTNTPRSWAGELRRIAYEAEDAVSTATTLSFPACTNRAASKKLQTLKEETLEIKSKVDQHAQGSNGGQMMLYSPGSRASMGHLHTDGDHVIGIYEDIKSLVGVLTRKYNYKDGQPPLVDRLAIVGMGGSGKTTLARSIYDHKAVKRHFNFRVWLTVSQGLDMSLLLLDILKQIRRQKWYFPLYDKTIEQPGHKPGELVSILNKLLYKETCLLVLDDVWDLESLHLFIDLIQNDSHSWKIVITSRQNPHSPLNWYIHHPQLLTDDDSCELFSMVASHSSKPISSELRHLSMEMLRKCDGLPLAIVELGRLLKKEDDMRGWQKVLNQIEAESTSMYGPLNKILGLSYEKLPYHLKLCLLYLGLFPEGSRIPAGPLTRMWIAEGLIKTEQLTPEAAARRYLQELIDHSMVQVTEKTCFGEPKFVRIHNMMRDFCISKAIELDFLAVSSSGAEAFGMTRRAAIDLRKSSILPELANNSKLRSLALFGQFSTNAAAERYTPRYTNITNICQMHKLLRVLEIYGINSHDGLLPGEIGDLIHLTYLRIRSTNIRKLPKSIGKLRNLLTLDYWDVFADTEVIVPNVLCKLVRLRHLYLPVNMSGSMEDLELDTLKDLITLWGVGGGSWLRKEMNKLSSTLRKLYIHGISYEEQLNAVLNSPSMMENSRLYALALNWYRFEFIISDQFSANMSLLRLKLVGNAPDKSHKQGYKFPSNLRKLELYYTQLERRETMALLGGLIFLKVLILGKDSYIGSEWTWNDQAFPVLEELKLADLPSLEKWEIEKGAFQCLKKLSIDSCIKLKVMPEEFKVLEKLYIEGMPSDFISKYQKVNGKGERGGACFDIIKHLSEVRVRCFRMVSTFAYNLCFWH